MVNRNQVPRGEPRSSSSSATTRMYTDITIASYEIATAGSNEVTIQIDDVTENPTTEKWLEENRDVCPPAPAQSRVTRRITTTMLQTRLFLAPTSHLERLSRYTIQSYLAASDGTAIRAKQGFDLASPPLEYLNGAAATSVGTGLSMQTGVYLLGTHEC